VVAQFIHEFARLDQRSGTENEYDSLSSYVAIWQIRHPTFTL
jgi:hypothetical protein